MMTLFSFLKPYRLSCFFIVLIVLADVGGSLLIPAITANMINLAVSGKGLDRILHLGVMMLAITVASGTLTLLGSWLSADFRPMSAGICATPFTTVLSSFHPATLKRSALLPC